jgi:hypothetical protein
MYPGIFGVSTPTLGIPDGFPKISVYTHKTPGYIAGMAKKKPTRGRPRDPKSLRSRGVTDRHLHPRKVFHAPTELLDRLSDYCERSERAEAEVIRSAIAAYLDHRC